MSKIGLVIPYWGDVNRSELIEVSRLAEELGFHSIWVPEMWGREAFSLLAFIAIHTKRINLGTGIVSVFSRTPAAIAQAIATLDEISEGRMILGLGTSGPVVIEDWHGIRFEKPLRRTREYIEIIRMILNGDRVNYIGEIFKLKNFRLQFTPPRKNIPIYIASIGPKNIHLTGELADGWIPFLIPRGYIQDAKKELTAGARAAGRDVGRIKVCPYIPACVSRDVDLSKRAIQEHIAYYVGGMGTFYHSVISRYGFREEADRILEAWKKGSKAQAIQSVSDTMIDSVAIFGTAQEGRRRLEEFRRAGADLPIIIFPPKASREMVKETIVELAPER